MDEAYTSTCCSRLIGPLCDRYPDSSKDCIAPDSEGVGDGTVGVRVGVLVAVGVPLG